MKSRLLICKKCGEEKNEQWISISGYVSHYLGRCIQCGYKFKENEEGYVVVEFGE
jgi:uncharacterized Zn finger protein